jgi:hypothetical protein
MTFSPSVSDWGETHPFILAHTHQDTTRGGYFRPSASVIVTPALRTSGLLRALPSEEVKTLLMLLTYVTPNGLFLATAPQMEEALRLAPMKLSGRLRRLLAFSWQGEPILRETIRDTGLRYYTPSAFLLTTHQPAPQEAEAPMLPPVFPAGREAVVEHSRQAYTHPRADVERQIAELNGWVMPPATSETASSRFEEPSPFADLRRRLTRFGLSLEQAEEVLANHPEEEIRRQLDWMPYRNARRPGPFLLAAIENRYAEPLALRRRRLFEDALAASATPPGSDDATGKDGEPPEEAAGQADLVPLAEGESLQLPTPGTEIKEPSSEQPADV